MNEIFKDYSLNRNAAVEDISNHALLTIACMTPEQVLNLAALEILSRNSSEELILSLIEIGNSVTRKVAFKKLADTDILSYDKLKSLFDNEPIKSIRNIIMPRLITSQDIPTAELYSIANTNESASYRSLAIKQLAKREDVTSNQIEMLLHHSNWATATVAIQELFSHKIMRLGLLIEYGQTEGNGDCVVARRNAAIDVLFARAKAVQAEVLSSCDNPEPVL